MPASARAPASVSPQVIPWNFPLLMLAWKIAPALACGNTVVLKPAETTPLTALAFADICRQADLPPGVVNIVTGAGDTGRALVEHPGVDKVAFTGSTEVGRQIARSVAGTLQEGHPGAGGKAANTVFDDAPLDQAVEGIVNGIFFNQGPCAAQAAGCWCRSRSPATCWTAQGRLATLRLGDPLDKNTDIGAINSPEQLARIRELSDAGEAEGAERWSPPCDLPDRGFWFPPTVFTGVSQAHRIAREEIFGPVLSVLTFRTRRGAGEGQQHPLRPVRPACGPRRAALILWMAQRLRAGVVWANTFNRFDPTSPFGGYKESGYGLVGATGWRPTSMSDGDGRLDVRKTYKLYIGGASPLRGGPHLRGAGSGRTLPGQRRPGLPQGRPRRGGGRPEAFGPWSGATAYNRGQVLYRVAEMLEGRRAQFVAEVSEADDLAPEGAGAVVDAAVDRWVWCAGWSDKIHQVAGSSNPVAGPTSTSRCPSPRAWWRCWPRRDRRCSAWSRSWPRSSWRATRARWWRPRPGRCRPSRCPRSWPPPTCPAASNLLTGPPPRSAPGSPAHGRQRHRPGRHRRRARRRPRAGGGRQPQAGRPPPAEVPDWTADPGPDRMLAYMETKTVWHPVGT